MNTDDANKSGQKSRWSEQSNAYYTQTINAIFIM